MKNIVTILLTLMISAITQASVLLPIQNSDADLVSRIAAPDYLTASFGDGDITKVGNGELKVIEVKNAANILDTQLYIVFTGYSPVAAASQPLTYLLDVKVGWTKQVINLDDDTVAINYVNPALGNQKASYGSFKLTMLKDNDGKPTGSLNVEYFSTWLFKE